jgi:hypothetical protein
MLNLGELERKLLKANNALSTDCKGDEVLRGLDQAESDFVVAVESTSNENIGAAESDAYRALRRKHLASRQMHNLQPESRRSARQEVTRYTQSPVHAIDVDQCPPHTPGVP